MSSTLRATLRLALGRGYMGIWLIWVFLAGILLINVALYAVFVPDDADANGALIALPVAIAVTGSMTAARHLPFALTVGMTRRRFYAEITGVMAAVFVLWSAGSATLAVVEEVTDGWGVGLRMFQLAGLLGDGWPSTFAVLFLGLVTAFAVGWIFGLLHRRWGVAGVLVVLGGLLVIGVVAGVLIAGVPAFAAVRGFFDGLTMARAVALLVASAVGTVVVGYLFTRRMPV